MALLSQILGFIGSLAIQTISYLGYGGIFVLMALESMVFPLPSELVMPFAGFLASQGKMSFTLVIVFSSLGSIAGSLLSYWMGWFGGNRFIIKYGKWFLLDKNDLINTERWFKKRGEWTIFVSRFIPVVRHLISIPAGIGKMDLKKFCIYTVAGATLWNSFLAYLGFLLGQNWNLIRQYSEPVSITVALILILAAGYFTYRHVKHKMTKK
jgi:membrane protein DedA with SNARE-associated domain